MKSLRDIKGCPTSKRDTPNFKYTMLVEEEELLKVVRIKSRRLKDYRDRKVIPYIKTGRSVLYEHNPEGKSRRCEECVTSWRYLVVESDDAPRELWLRVLVQLPLPIAAIYDSGKRGVLALVRVDAESKAHWDEIVRIRLLPILVTLGACDDSLTAVRLTRLPNCRRGQTGNMQSLLYLNPQPDYTPIAHRRTYGA